MSSYRSCAGLLTWHHFLKQTWNYPAQLFIFPLKLKIQVLMGWPPCSLQAKSSQGRYCLVVLVPGALGVTRCDGPSAARSPGAAPRCVRARPVTLR